MTIELYDRAGSLVGIATVPDSRRYPDVIMWHPETGRRFFMPKDGQFVEVTMTIAEKVEAAQ